MAGAMILGDRDSGRVVLGDGNPDISYVYGDDKWLKDGGLSREQLLRFLDDVHYEPTWRKQSDLDVDYYDNYQLSQELLQLYEQRNLPPLIVNLVHPTINTVLGLEAKNRSGLKVTFEDEASEQTARALNKKFLDATRNAYFDRAVSDTYGGTIKAGLGWIEINDNPNPLQFRYRTRYVHRREIWWDWRDQDMALSDARWLIRKKWFDDDILKKVIPGYEDMIGTRAPMDAGLEMFTHLDEATGRGSDLEFDRAQPFELAEWRDTQRRRSVLYEVWYRVFTEAFVVRLPNDKVVEVDPANVDQMRVIAAGVIKPMRALTAKMRQAFFLGPHRFLDRWTPLPHQHFPYVPMWGFREDLSSMPYGVIRTMRGPQDEINARRAKLMALLSARRVRLDSDAVSNEHNSLQDVADSASNHDYFIVTNPARKRDDAVHIDTNLDLAKGQMDILHESKDEIHQTSGIFTAQQGETSPGMSGYAYNTLIEQGTTTLAEINDNYRYARHHAAELLFEHVKRDSVHPHEVVVGEGKQRTTIYLNQRQPGSPAVINDVEASTARVELEEVPATQGYRQQQFMLLTEMTKTLPPQIQAFVVPFIMEATDLADRKSIASTLRRQLGMPEQDASGGVAEPQVSPEMQQMQAALQELAGRLQQAEGIIQTKALEHKNRMEELEAERELAQIKHGQAMQAATTPKAGAAPGGGKAAAAMPAGHMNDMAELRDVVAEMAAELARLKQGGGAPAAAAGPKRQIIKELPGGGFEVTTVPGPTTVQ